MKRAPWTRESLPPRSVAARLLTHFFQFDFFQAVRILEQLDPERTPIGRAGPPSHEVVRFKALASLSFPPSAIAKLTPPTPIPWSGDQALTLPPALTIPFMGLTGPSGVLPRHYTELLMRIEKELRTPEKYALRDWFDLFNHRFVSLFYRAWEKYRFDVTYTRRRDASGEPELFTHLLSSLVGLGTQGLQNRMRVVSCWEYGTAQLEERVLAKVEHLAMVYYSGLLAHRPRNALGLEALLHDYFRLPVRIVQFQGHWVQLEESKQSRLGDPSGYTVLGSNAVVGERVWDVQGKIRVRLGPLTYEQFQDLLPDREPFPERKTFFELAHLVRFYVGVELAFDVQLILLPDQVPECRLADGTGDGPQLGWNTWLQSQSFADPVEDGVFDGEDIVWVNRPSEVASLAQE